MHQRCFWTKCYLIYFDFAVIDVAAGEYGHEFIDKMISLVDNGRCLGWKPYDENVAQKNYKNEKYSEMITDEFEEEINPKHLRARSTYWQQFWTLYKRRTLQMWRDSVKPIPLICLINFGSILLIFNSI